MGTGVVLLVVMSVDLEDFEGSAAWMAEMGLWGQGLELKMGVKGWCG